MSDLSEIEEQIATDREKLTNALDGLTETLDPERIAGRVTSTVEGYSGEMGRQVMDMAKQNPAAVAFVAAGLGLLFTGTGSTRERAAAARYQANSPVEAMDGFDARVAAADAEMKSRMGPQDDGPSASWLKEHLESGLEALPASARRRVLKARKAAIAAQERVEAKAAKLARQSRAFHAEQPLVVGGIALGVGALVAALLPSTRQEDALLGQHRDTLMAKAQDALARETAQLKNAAQEGLRAAANHSERRERGHMRG